MVRLFSVLGFVLTNFLVLSGFSQQNWDAEKGIAEKVNNPILSGFHPDPSIVRVGENYYLVNSSFEWFPGLPIYHSKDLVNWQLIGYGLDRIDQIPLEPGLPDSRGLYAPAIRFHQGKFYIINTCVNCGGNFFITASDPAGPWSDPVWLGTKGIDPSLFWDDDGRSYYVGHGNLNSSPEWPAQTGVWIQEIDLKNGKMLGSPKQLTFGHAANARWTEGPHIYKVDGKYVLIVAEGGTDFHHAVTVHQSDDLLGPYVPNHTNPVLSHRHLGKDFPIYAVGHTDLVQTQKGDWWAVMLAKRKHNGFTLLARETFLLPVVWEKQEGFITPVFNPGKGIISEEIVKPDLPWSPGDKPPIKDEFDGVELAKYWNFLRVPKESWYTLAEGYLKLTPQQVGLSSTGNPSFIARRIEDFDYEVACSLHFEKERYEAGLSFYRSSRNHIRFLVSPQGIRLITTKAGEEMVEKIGTPMHGDLVLKVVVKGTEGTCFIGKDLNSLREIGNISLECLSDEISGGFNGPYVGVYAEVLKGKETSSTIQFDWFSYEK